MATKDMKINTLAGWFGSNRENAPAVGKQIGKVTWCGVPFCGGASELPFIETRGGVANDLHRHIINLARVVRTPLTRSLLEGELNTTLFHPDELRGAQERCIARERAGDFGLFSAGQSQDSFGAKMDVAWARDYFVCCWMGRGGQAGKHDEFHQNISTRWTSSGGSSAKRFHSTIESLVEWSKALERWEFKCMDAFEFLAKCKDADGYAIYCDAPWVGMGDDYTHRFNDQMHRQLAKALGRFTKTRVVIRYGVHPLIDELYSPEPWHWIRHTTQNQRGGEVFEALIINGRRY